MPWYKNKVFMSGAVFMLGLGLAAQALHWFITPMAHPGATTFQTVMVVVQLVFGVILVVSATRFVGRNQAQQSAEWDRFPVQRR